MAKILDKAKIATARSMAERLAVWREPIVGQKRIEYNEKCCAWAEKAALLGDLRSQLMVAAMLINRSRGEEEDPRAIEYLKNWFMADEDKSYFKGFEHWMACLYINGIWINPDPDRAHIWFLKAQKYADAETLYDFACALVSGEHNFFTQKALDSRFANEFQKLRDSYDQERERIVIRKGEHILSRDKGIFWHTKAANLGFTHSMFKLSDIYQEYYFYRDPALSVSWLEKAAKAGDSYAYLRLGKLFFHGIKGISENYEKAFSFFEQDPLSADCNFYLGLMYEAGFGTEPDQSKAIEHYVMAANPQDTHKSTWACRKLGTIYELGDGVEINYDTAAKYYREVGIDSWALRNIGKLLETGKITPSEFPDPSGLKEAADYFHLADDVKRRVRHPYRTFEDACPSTPGDVQLDKSKSHDPDYLYQLGCAFTYGKGLPFDHFKAFELFKKASEKGHGRAQLMLASMYMGGFDWSLGHWSSDYQFVKWIKMAAENGVLEAQREIEECQLIIEEIEGEV